MKCLCDCCNEKSIRLDHLKSGATKTCGHQIDMIGKTFGKLTVKEKVDKKDRPIGSNDVYWLCDCSCGTSNYLVAGSNLRNGKTTSCGCISSKNEEKIRIILTNNNIKFKPQFTLSDLRSPTTKYPLRFDFAIFDKNDHIVMFIEYDGIQHFKVVEYSKEHIKNKREFKRLQASDKIKNEYCKRNGFSLLRIPYICEDYVEELIISACKEKGVI